jgi:hypothetical protein
MRMIHQFQQENPDFNDSGIIDDFPLWGANRCRRMGEYSTETRLFTCMVHTLNNHNVSLSEGGAPPVVVRGSPETPHQTRDNTDLSRLMRQSEARLRLARPPSPGAAARPTREGAGGGSDPAFLTADVPRGRGRLFMPSFILFPCLWGSLPPPRSFREGN